MKVINVSTFLPTQCGLATFSNDLVNSLRFSPLVAQTQVVAVSPEPKQVFAPPVIAAIQKQDQKDYRRVAKLVNKLQPDAVMIQHEYGIFGGKFGEYVLDFVDELSVPLVVTLHTVLTEHEPGQARVLKALCARASQVLVFTERAKQLVVAAKLVDETKINVVPHGAPPEITKLSEVHASARPKKRSKFVVSSFGLLAPRKGLELTIEAVGKVARKHPEIRLIIAGQIHPEVLRREGSKYHDSLQSLVKKLKLQDKVFFDKRFLGIEDLADLLGKTDLFVSAYRGREQIVSGALSFAIAAGCACVSTPYRYAEDMLSTGAGTLVPFGDSDALANAITSYILSPTKLHKAQSAARQIGRELSWPAVGQLTAEILQHAATGQSGQRSTADTL
jgi:glycosyltransferase involved in cell wall biosynthesis